MVSVSMGHLSLSASGERPVRLLGNMLAECSRGLQYGSDSVRTEDHRGVV